MIKSMNCRPNRGGAQTFGQLLEVKERLPEYAAEDPVIVEATQLFSPDYAPEEIYEIAAKLM